jgi:hypothetical protein
VLAHTSNLWVEETVKFANHQFASVASPSSSGRYSLIFMHLPDGNLKGQGFSAYNYETLAKLEGNSITAIHAVDHQSAYSRKALIGVLQTLIDLYQPDEIRTQLPYSADMTFADHSDHMAVGRYATEAAAPYKAAHPLMATAYYIGYPIHAFEPNVEATDLAQKEQAFLAYSSFDGATCTSAQMCAASSVYSAYLSRQYRVENP